MPKFKFKCVSYNKDTITLRMKYPYKGNTITHTVHTAKDVIANIAKHYADYFEMRVGKVGKKSFILEK